MSLSITTDPRQPSVTIDAGTYGVLVDVGARSAVSILGLANWPATHGPSFALEDGGALLLETGDRLLLE